MNVVVNENIPGYAVRISAIEDGVEVGHAYLYIIRNDFHEQPYGLMEYVFVHEAFRGRGIGKQLISGVLEEAKKKNCYKLIAQSRHGRDGIHTLYEKFGFQNHGINFRMDF